MCILEDISVIPNGVYTVEGKVDLITLFFGDCIQCCVSVKLCVHKMSNLLFQCIAQAVVFTPNDSIMPISSTWGMCSSYVSYMLKY